MRDMGHFEILLAGITACSVYDADGVSSTPHSCPPCAPYTCSELKPWNIQCIHTDTIAHESWQFHCRSREISRWDHSLVYTVNCDPLVRLYLVMDAELVNAMKIMLPGIDVILR
jgi:hypothetical protein